LQEFVEKDLILHLDGRYLSLALPENPNFDLAALPDYQPVEMEAAPIRRDMPVQIT